MNLSRSSLASFLTLGLLAVIGTVLILIATPEGLGLSDDSIAYIAGARSMLAGQGYREAWLESNQPVTHFPPAFSSVLALTGLVGVRPINGARLINSLLFGINAALLGLLGWRMTKSSIAGIVLAALFVANSSLFHVHAVAMSEPLFLFFSLLAFLCFDLALVPDPTPGSSSKGRGEKWLVVTGLLTSLAYLTRYSGLALVATFVVALILLNATWKKRIAGTLVYLAGFFPLALAWNIRNRIVAGNATNRTLLWHPVTSDTLRQGLRTFSEFLVPIEEWRSAWFKKPEIFISIIIILSLIILVWILVNGLRRFFKPSTPLPEVIGFTNGLYVFGYMASVLFSISLFDASTPLKVRILAPAYLPLLLLLVGAGMWVWNRRQVMGRGLVVGLAVLIFSVSIVGQARTVSELSRGGVGFASFKWYDSKVMDYVNTLPANIFIYTNQPGAVYLYTGRGGRVLPSHVDPVTGLAEPNFDKGIQTLRTDVLAGHAALVVFDPDSNPGYQSLVEGLPLVFKSSGDVVYYAPRP